MGTIFMGSKRHGKDTACEFLKKSYGLSFASSSEVACDLFLFEKLKHEFGYKNRQECFDDRHNHRKRWYDEICEFNKFDRARLGKIIFSSNDIYCGLRDLAEYEALKAAGYVDLTVWVDASQRLESESAESMTVHRGLADVVIDNNGNELLLEQQLIALVRDYIRPLQVAHAAKMSFGY